MTITADSEASLIRRMLTETRAIAVVGASIKPERPSYFVSRYLQQQGYRILPVNPAYVGQRILGEPVAPSLGALTEQPDMVAVFRRSAFAGGIALDAIECQIRFVWMQVGIRDEQAAAEVRVRGGSVVMNRCLMVEHRRLLG